MLSSPEVMLSIASAWMSWRTVAVIVLTINLLFPVRFGFWRTLVPLISHHLLAYHQRSERAEVLSSPRQAQWHRADCPSIGAQAPLDCAIVPRCQVSPKYYGGRLGRAEWSHVLAPCESAKWPKTAGYRC